MKAWNAGYIKGGNKKVRGAKKTVVDGVTFDSQLEAHLFSGLKNTGIEFETQKSYELQGGFRYRGVAIRSIYIVVDFWIPSLNLLLDTKGWQTADSKIKWKMLKQKLNMALIFPDAIHKEPPEIQLLRTKKECDSLILQLLSKTRK